MRTEAPFSKPSMEGLENALRKDRAKRLNSAYVAAALFLVDLVLLNVAFLMAYWLRYYVGIGGAVADENFLALSVYTPIQITLTVALSAIYSLAGFYKWPRRSLLVQDSISALSATSIGMMLFLAVVFLLRGLAYSRGLFLMAWALIVLFLVVARVLERLLRAYLHLRGIGVKIVLVIGGEQLGRAVMHVVSTEGFLHDGPVGDTGRFKRLGGTGDLAQIIHSQNIDEVIMAMSASAHVSVPGVAETCRREGVAFKIVPDLYEMSFTSLDIDDLRGIPVIGMKEVSIRGVNLLVKRGMDIVFSTALVAILSPLWAFIVLLIKLDSPGPVYFRQQRAGTGGRPFTALKFRSMRDKAEADLSQLMDKNEATGPLFKMKQDPRITRVGRFLRRTSLDELPQLINVLLGDMSLVGPRPPLPSEVEQYERWHLKRLDVAPGLTGLWQVSGRSELPFDEMVMLDIYYIENWSLGLDIQILLRTIPAVISGRGAY
ncbi:MAG: Undecaprenyl-phosphate galactose phosphotransferase [Dehalococcoidia bacterium]|nr:Undecaprenyl-phosphate galactose phosphotransferase [Dehalococcoidia bacterium]